MTGRVRRKILVGLLIFLILGCGGYSSVFMGTGWYGGRHMIENDMLPRPEKTQPPLPPKEDGWDVIQDDLIVLNNQIIKNKIILLTGNLSIMSDAFLLMENVTLIFNCSRNGEWGVKVSENAKLHVYNSTIISVSSSLSYRFEAYGGMVMKRCNISYLWGTTGDYSDEEGGIQIFSNDVSISDSIIKYSEGNGISCIKSSPMIFNNTITLNSGNGIVCGFKSSPKIVNNVISSNSWCGIWASGDVVIEHNTITRNAVGICTQISYGSFKIFNNTILYNIHGITCSESNFEMVNTTIMYNNIGLVCYFSSPLISNCVISNSTEYDLMLCGGGSHPKVYNTTLDENKIYIAHLSSSLTIDGRVIHRDWWEFPIGVIYGFMVAIIMVLILIVVDILIEKRRKKRV